MEKSYIVPGMDTPARAKTVKKALLSSKNVLFVDVCPEKRRARILAAGLFDERKLFDEARGAGFLLLYDSPEAYRRAIGLETGGALRLSAAALLSGVFFLACALLPQALRGGGSAAFGNAFLRAVFLAPILILNAPALIGGARDLAAGRGSLASLCLIGTACGLFSGAYGAICAAYGVRSSSAGLVAAAALLNLYAAARAAAALLPAGERERRRTAGKRAFGTFANGLRGRPLLRALDGRAEDAARRTLAAFCLPAAAALAVGRNILSALLVGAACGQGAALLFLAGFTAALAAENLRARQKTGDGAGKRKNDDGARRQKSTDGAGKRKNDDGARRQKSTDGAGTANHTDVA